ncbi:MAG: LegC family aminotransferase [Candidatus Cloacimonadia bacterium]
MFSEITRFIRSIFNEPDKDIPLHAPVFCGKEKEYLMKCIDSTFVSSVGKYVDLLEDMVAEYTGAHHAVATVNGTAALHLALVLSGVHRDEEIITQAVSFVATANAISYCGAHPIFLDSDRDTLGLSPDAVVEFLSENCVRKNNGSTYNKKTGRKISACIPMHVFGHPVRIDQIKAVCDEYHIDVVEDSAESIGSMYLDKHTGTFGQLGILSFNGNKTITTGGGGMILTDNEELAEKAKHLSTTAKVPHQWEFVHDHAGFNYRLPNINAALGCAQMEQLSGFIEKKRELAKRYRDFFSSIDIPFAAEPNGCRSNYWLNAILLRDRAERDAFLKYSNDEGVMTRPLWTLMPDLVMYGDCQTDELTNARWLEDRVVCLPSSVLP